MRYSRTTESVVAVLDYTYKSEKDHLQPWQRAHCGTGDTRHITQIPASLGLLITPSWLPATFR
jgi:hypothetical protein